MFFNLFKPRKSRISMKRPDICEFTGELYVNQPRVKVLANDRIASFLCDSGASFSRMCLGNGERSGDSIDLLERPYDLLRRAKGCFCYVQTPSASFCTTYAPDYSDTASYEAAFSKAGVTYFAATAELKVITQVRVHVTLPCEQRELLFESKTEAPLPITLFIMPKPALSSSRGMSQEGEHISEQRASISVSFDKQSNAIIAQRDIANCNEQNGKAIQETAYLAIGFWENTPFSLAMGEDANMCRGEQGDGFALKLSSTIEKGEVFSCHLLLASGTTKSEALSTLHVMRQQKPIDTFSASQHRLSSSASAHRVTQTLLPQLLFSKRDSTAHLDAAFANTLGAGALAPYGFGGELPIVVVDIFSQNDKERITAYLNSYRFLNKCFLPFDLVFFYEGGKEAEGALRAMLLEAGVTGKSRMGGVHLIPKRGVSPQRTELLYASACHIATRSMVQIEVPSPRYIPLPIDGLSGQSGERLLVLRQKSEDAHKDTLEECFLLPCDARQGVLTGKYGALQVTLAAIDAQVLQMKIKLQNPTEEVILLSLGYCDELLFGEKRLRGSMINGEQLKGEPILLLHDPNSGFWAIRADSEFLGFCCDRTAFFSGNWESPATPPLYEICGGIIFTAKLLPHCAKTFGFTEAFAKTKEEAIDLLIRHYEDETPPLS